jgi:hypothetical protein
MRVVSRAAVEAALIVAVLVAPACGGNPPEKEIQQAQSAVDAARAAGAEQYASDDYKAAADALKQCREAVSQRDYRLALNHAIESRERALIAVKEATDQKSKVRTESERALADGMQALALAHDRLKAAVAGRVAPRTLQQPRKMIAAAEASVQKSRAAMSREDFGTARDAAADAADRARTAARDIDVAITTRPQRRRR